ncbi:PIN domain-containing protein [Sphingomonas lenta]|uniref:PIN domain-containing protein n=1 Tax=Sphingomonas lenta TaxID=1141887 RepID=A0A2A2SHN8_9SPHN|nr:PIN domain-containing protein [Sphingomonas lenta]PAX08732.1 hypothetical protein CKY28_05060 [Sphingomonas lenta]
MIVDANPIISACLGRSRPLFTALLGAGIDLFAPEQQMREAELIVAREGRSRGQDLTRLFGWVGQALSIVPNDIYSVFEGAARERLQPAGQKDWPLLALALATNDDVWSNDVDLFGTGIPVWNTHNIRRTVLRSAQLGTEHA